MTSSTKFTFDFFKTAENFNFLYFALMISSGESQSNTQFNLQSLGVNKTVYRAENIEFLSTDENFKKSPHLFALTFLYPPDNALLQARSHGGSFGGSPPKNFFCDPKISCSQKICFKNMIKTKIVPPKNVFCPFKLQNLATGLYYYANQC